MKNKSDNMKDEIKLFLWVSLGMSVVAGFCAIYSIDSSNNFPKLRIFSILALISMGGTSVGGFLGFLFGIPKTSQVSDQAIKEHDNQKLLNNTNLEQISDWLTKIIIGIALTDIDKVGNRLWNFSELVSKLSTPKDTSAAYDPGSLTVFVFFLIICSGISGFFGGYFTSKFILHRALQILQISSIKEDTEK